MKVLSCRQPMAWLVVAGYKPIETRTWMTKYRGPLYIHASGKYGKAERKCFYDILDSKIFDEETTEFLEQVEAHCEPEHSMLYTGGIIGKVELTEISPCPYPSFSYFVSHKAQHLCIPTRNYTWRDRYAWTIEKAQAFEWPIECPGALSLWTPPPAVIEKVNAAKIISTHFRIGAINAIGA